LLKYNANVNANVNDNANENANMKKSALSVRIARFFFIQISI